MTQVMGTRANKEAKAPEGRKLLNLNFLRPSGAWSFLPALYPRLTPGATLLRPLQGLTTFLSVCSQGLRRGLHSARPLQGLFSHPPYQPCSVFLCSMGDRKSVV